MSDIITMIKEKQNKKPTEEQLRDQLQKNMLSYLYSELEKLNGLKTVKPGCIKTVKGTDFITISIPWEYELNISIQKGKYFVSSGGMSKSDLSFDDVMNEVTNDLTSKLTLLE